jgi:hypothetical protein
MNKLIALVLLFSLSAQASYYATHCSNSRGDVRWETGHNSNQLFIRLDSDVPSYIQIDIFKVEIRSEKEVILSEETVHRCGFRSYTKVYAEKVTITPSMDYPDSLDFLDGDKKIVTDVICTNRMNSRAPCPQKIENL